MTHSKHLTHAQGVRSHGICSRSDARLKSKEVQLNIKGNEQATFARSILSLTRIHTHAHAHTHTLQGNFIEPYYKNKSLLRQNICTEQSL